MTTTLKPTLRITVSHTRPGTQPKGSAAHGHERAKVRVHILEEEKMIA